MSVTFDLMSWHESESFTGWVIGTFCEHVCTSNDPCEDWAIYSYCDHKQAAIEACGCDAFSMNVSNANAVSILERLGLPYDVDGLYGEIDADDLLGRAMVANVGRLDDGMPAVEYKAEGSATMVDCGRPPSYFDARMEALAVLAAEAKRRGVKVGWA